MLYLPHGNSVKPSVPKGTRDFSPTEMVRRNYIFDTIKSVFRKYGYQQIETPSMETSETLLGKYGDEGDKLLFKILDNGEFLDLITTKSFINEFQKGLDDLLSDKQEEDMEAILDYYKLAERGNEQKNKELSQKLNSIGGRDK